MFADLLEFLGEGLVVLDVFLGLRLGDRQVFDHFGQALPQRGPVGGGLAGPRDDLRLGPPRRFEAVACHVAHDRVVLTDQELGLPLARRQVFVELAALVADIDQGS